MQHYITFNWCFLLLAVQLSEASLKTHIRLTPDDPNVIVGRNLHMTCQLYSSRYRARDLRFQFRLFNADDHIEASASDIHVVNASVAELNYTNMRPHFDRAIIVCYHNNNPDLEAVQIIKVGYLPSPPRIIKKSIRVYNWDTFKFSWRVKRHDNVYYTRYTAWYKPAGYSHFINCNECHGRIKNCPQQINNSCSVPKVLHLVHPSGHMDFKVNATSEIGFTTSKTLEGDLYHYIQPEPVKELVVQQRGISSPVVSFQSPHSQKTLRYSLLVNCSSRYLKRNKTVIRSFKTDVELTDLPSFTFCTVTVRCKPWNKSKSYGFWSESRTITFQSQEGVPVAAPQICQSCFEVTMIDATVRKTVLYYKRLSKMEARAHNAEYRAFALNEADQTALIGCNASTTIGETDPQHFISLNLSADSRYHVALLAFTAAGCNASLSNNTIFIPTQKEVLAEPRNLTVIALDKSLVQMSWKPPKNAGSRRYVAVWCKGDRTCLGDISWKVTDHTYKHSVTLDSGTFHQYRFGLAIEMGSWSSGITWSSCTYNRNSVAKPPTLDLKGSSEITISLIIRQPHCKQHYADTGYVYGYAIYYYRADKPELVNKLLVDESTMSLDSYVVDGLEPDTWYKFYASSLTVSGPSYENSSLVEGQTGDAGLATGHIAMIVVAVILALVFVVIGAVSCFKWQWKKIHKWTKVKVQLPPSLTDEFRQNNDPSRGSYSFLGSEDVNQHIASTISSDRCDHGDPDGRLSETSETSTGQLSEALTTTNDGPDDRPDEVTILLQGETSELHSFIRSFIESVHKEP